MEMATKAIGAAGGCGVPTIKPWNIDTIREKMAQARRLAALPWPWTWMQRACPSSEYDPAGRQQGVEELAEMVKLASGPSSSRA